MNDKEKKMNDQEQIELFKSLLGAVIDVLDLSKSEINELKTTPAELVKMVIAQKNDIIKAQTEMLEDAISVLSLSPETIEKHRKLGTTPAGLIKIVIKEKNDEIERLEKKLNGINQLSKLQF